MISWSVNLSRDHLPEFNYSVINGDEKSYLQMEIEIFEDSMRISMQFSSYLVVTWDGRYPVVVRALLSHYLIF